MRVSIVHAPKDYSIRIGSEKLNEIKLTQRDYGTWFEYGIKDRSSLMSGETKIILGAASDRTYENIYDRTHIIW